MNDPKCKVLVCVAVTATVLLLGACGGDPVRKVLKERARWEVTLLSFTVQEDGRSQATFRLSGPVKSNLDTLTIRIDMRDANDEVIQSLWSSFDLSDVQRGVPTEKTVFLPATEVPVEGISMDLVIRPSEDDFVHIPELSGVEP